MGFTTSLTFGLWSISVITRTRIASCTVGYASACGIIHRRHPTLCTHASSLLNWREDPYQATPG